jgi:MiaB/RimO family radical SAM methylthiotransferase
MLPDDYYIKVSTGCLNSCTYCAVKISREEVKSRPIKSIIADFEKGLGKGAKDFALIGTDVGSYGREIGTDLSNLLKELLNKEGDYRIKIRNVNPRFFIEMLPSLEECFQSGKIVHIGSAAQSGSNKILKRMNRIYTIEDYKHAVRSVQTKFPDIHFRTQLMVGFPGETSEDFQKTLHLLDSIYYDFIELYKYSQRPGTLAATLDNQVSEHVIDKRHDELYVKALINMCKKRFLKGGRGSIENRSRAVAPASESA